MFFPQPRESDDLPMPEGNEPWPNIARVVSDLRNGRFDSLPRLLELLGTHREADVWHACGLLMGFAGGDDLLRLSVDRLGRLRLTPTEHAQICAMLSYSRRSWAPEAMLALYSRVVEPQERAHIEIYLSCLLEAVRGEVWRGPEEVDLPRERDDTLSDTHVFVDIESYVTRTRSLAGDAQRLIGDKCMAFGEVESLRHIAETLLADARRGDDNGRVEWGRMVIEATAEVDCRPFYDDNYKFQPLAACAILEDLLTSGVAREREPGVRYIFGHRVP